MITNVAPIAVSSPDVQGTSATRPERTPSNQLGPDSFITLLTTQLQAQDPLNPLDPSQMISELTSMNTFQQILVIRQDLDALVSAAQGSPAPSGSTSATQKAAIAAAQAASSNTLPISSSFGSSFGSQSQAI